MGEAEARAFEEYCVANPEFARQVEYEQRLKAGLAQVARGSTAEFVRSEHPLRWNIAAAAGVLLALVRDVFRLEPLRPHGAKPAHGRGHQRQRSADGPSLRLALVRGTETAPALPAGCVRVEIVGLFDPGISLQRRARPARAEQKSTRSPRSTASIRPRRSRWK